MSIVFNKKNNNCLINNTIIVSVEDGLELKKLKNLNETSFTYNSENEIWIYNNYKRSIPLIKILYPEEKISSIDFKNNNVNDYQRDNLILTYDKRFIDKFDDPPNVEIISKGTSYKITDGKFAGQYRNMYWKVKNNINETYYLMHIKDDIYTKISKRDIKKVLNINNVRQSWFINVNGYVSTTFRADSKVYNIYLHQLIMNVHNEDLTNYEKTVDHINQDKLDNRQTNLRLVNMSIQNTNKGKAKRRVDACDLPEELDESLPKYVVYRKEILDKDSGNFREYFYICNHPKLDKNWETTKSQKVSIKEKLKQAKLKLQEIDGDITEKEYLRESNTNNKIDLPIGIRFLSESSPYKFVFDLRKNNIRYGLTNVLKSTNLQNELDLFINAINKKYPELNYSAYKIINKIKINEKNVSQPDTVKEDLIKLVLPTNFSFYFDIKGKAYYYCFAKSDNGKMLRLKRKVNTKNYQTEFNNFMKLVNDKFPHIKLTDYTIPNLENITENDSSEINDSSETNNSSDSSNARIIIVKPIMPQNFSICNVNNIDYIQFCKKINGTKYQYKTKINSYDLNTELNEFINDLNEKYKLNLINLDYIIKNPTGWMTTNKIVDHTETPEKILQRAQAQNYIQNKINEIGLDEFRKQKAEYAQQYRSRNN
jgi:hypothetical protein